MSWKHWLGNLLLGFYVLTLNSDCKVRAWTRNLEGNSPPCST
jgi:hypothetical protein